MPDDRVAGLEQRHVDGVVGLGAGVRLDVGVLGAEQLLGAVDRQLLGDVDLLAAAVVAAARDSPRRTCWSAPSRPRRAPPGGRSSPRRSSPACPAGARSSRSSTAAISGSTSASGAVWKFSGSSLTVRSTIPTARDTLWPGEALASLASPRSACRRLAASSPRPPRPRREPLQRPGSGELLCPDLRVGPAEDLFVEHAGRHRYGYGGRRAPARRQRHPLARARADGAARPALQAQLDARQPGDLPGRRRRRDLPHRGASSTSTTSATSAAAPTGRSTTR